MLNHLTGLFYNSRYSLFLVLGRRVVREYPEKQLIDCVRVCGGGGLVYVCVCMGGLLYVCVGGGGLVTD